MREIKFSGVNISQEKLEKLIAIDTEKRVAWAASFEGRRETKFVEIITKLNKQRRQGENEIFDCGELGFVHIYMKGSHWAGRWFMPSQEFAERMKGGEG